MPCRYVDFALNILLQHEHMVTLYCADTTAVELQNHCHIWSQNSLVLLSFVNQGSLHSGCMIEDYVLYRKEEWLK